MDKKIALACQGKSAGQGGMNVPEIRQTLKDRGLNWTGTRSVLIQRLCDTMASRPASASASGPASAPAPAPADRMLSEKDLTFDPKRKIIYLESPFLRTLAGIMLNSDREIGGAVDLKLDGAFDRNIYGIGGYGSVALDDFVDFEIGYHTHPYMSSRCYNLPSQSDIRAAMGYMLKHEQQVHLVFTHDAIYAIYTNPVAKVLSLNKINQIYNRHGIVSEESLCKDSVLSVFKELADNGVYIQRHSNGKKQPSLNPIDSWPDRIPIYVNPQEPNIALPRLIEPRDIYG